MWVGTVATALEFPTEATTQTSVVAELCDPVLVEPEVVRELVQNRDADLLAQVVRVREALLERDPVDRDLVGELTGHVAALRERNAVVEAEEVGVVRVLVLDDDRDVLEGRGEVGRQLVERGTNVPLERHGRRLAISGPDTGS